MHKKVYTAYFLIAVISMLCLPVQTTMAKASHGALLTFFHETCERGSIGIGGAWKGLRMINQDTYFDSLVEKTVKNGNLEMLSEPQDYLVYAAADATLDIVEALVADRYHRKKRLTKEYVSDWFKNWLTTTTALVVLDCLPVRKAGRAWFVFIVKTAINKYQKKKAKEAQKEQNAIIPEQ